MAPGGSEKEPTGGGVADGPRPFSSVRRLKPREVVCSPEFQAAAAAMIGPAWETDPRLLAIRFALARWTRRYIRSWGLVGSKDGDGLPIRFIKTQDGLFVGVVLVTFSVSADDERVTLRDMYDVSHQVDGSHQRTSSD